MTKILNSRLIQTVSAINFSTVSTADFNTIFTEFSETLRTQIDSESEYKAAFRLIADVDIALVDIKISKKHKEHYSLLSKTRKNVESEKTLLNRRLTNPELFVNYNKETSSSLRWIGTPTELAELLTALDLAGVFTDTTGAKMEFSELIRTFETLFNINLGEAHDLKRRILRRKTKLTVFLDRLKSSL